MDLAFAVSGEGLPRDHALALFEALGREAPELAAHAGLAVLGIRGASAGGPGWVLGHRSRLLLRLPETLVESALALCGRSLEVGSGKLRLGAAKTRALVPHPTLYAQRVAADRDDEASFAAQVASALGALGVRPDFVVGRRSAVQGPAGEIAGYSLMVTELPARQSLALQTTGLGAYRQLGFGIFVGHK